jgi:hypothetical protein
MDLMYVRYYNYNGSRDRFNAISGSVESSIVLLR